MGNKWNVETQPSLTHRSGQLDGTGLAWGEGWPRAHPSPLDVSFQLTGSHGLLQDFFPCGLAGQGKNNSHWKKT